MHSHLPLCQGVPAKKKTKKIKRKAIKHTRIVVNQDGSMSTVIEYVMPLKLFEPYELFEVFSFGARIMLRTQYRYIYEDYRVKNFELDLGDNGSRFLGVMSM
jgi:hypothetical protein